MGLPAQHLVSQESQTVPVAPGVSKSRRSASLATSPIQPSPLWITIVIVDGSITVMLGQHLAADLLNGTGDKLPKPQDSFQDE